MAEFRDRDEAGARLAEAVAALDPADPVVLALPRGGVPVALPVAERLGAPLDLLMVRKLGLPGHEELAAGAVVDGPAREAVFNPEVLAGAGLREADFEEAIARKLAEIETRRARYLGDRAAVPLEARTAIVVDDGIATGATMKAALRAVRRQGPAAVILAVPVAPADTIAALRPLVDDVVCLSVPSPFYAVGMHYTRFEQVGDDAVAAMMKRAPGAGTSGDGT